MTNKNFLLNMNLETLSIPSNIEVSIACCILTRNNEESIELLLESISGVFDEVIVVDTGSTDRTIDILEDFCSFHLSIYHFDWNDNFSAVRNYAISKVSSSWVFFLDSDEILNEEFEIREFKKFLYTLEVNNEKNIIVLCPTIQDSKNKKNIFGVERIFKVSNDLVYNGLVHEHLVTNDNDSYIKRLNLIPLITHYGYEKLLVEKHKRNLKLLRIQIMEDPNNLRWIYFYVKESYFFLSPVKREKIIMESIIVNQDNPISSSNVKKSIYTNSILFVLCEIYFAQNLNEEFNKILTILKELNGNSNDIFYYEKLQEYLKIQSELFDLTDELVSFRKKHNFFGQDSINSNGTHLDVLIASCFFDTKRFSSSFKLLKMLEHQNNQNPLVLEYLNYFTSISKLSH